MSNGQPKVGILMGSDSDLEVMREAAKRLESFGIGMAAVTILSIPSLALFLGLQKYFIQGISAGSLKS